jgi:TonB family protein
MLEREYPPLLRAAGVEGQAVIDFVVDEQGVPRDVKVERATHEGFGQAGVAVMREARFIPARVGTRAVPMRIQIPIGFKLSTRTPAGPEVRPRGSTLMGPAMGDTTLPQITDWHHRQLAGMLEISRALLSGIEKRDTIPPLIPDELRRQLARVL